jgi:hypothetical protein
LIEHVASDFDVSLVAKVDDDALFMARRDDVWHFVQATETAEGNRKGIGIRQFHCPRYSIARQLRSVADGSAMPATSGSIALQRDGAGVAVGIDGRVFPLPPKAIEHLREDQRWYDAAVRAVRETGEGFEVPGALTSQGASVIADVRGLAEAIAFEREVRKELDPRKFGVYSAFCTWSDFIRDDDSRKDSIAAGMASEMVSWDPTTFGDDAYWASVTDIQQQFWNRVFWNRETRSDEDTLDAVFRSAFNELTSKQFAQFVLMNGMHKGGPFHALATLLGAMSFERYNEWRTYGMAPDSEEAQKIMTQTAFIQLLAIAAA